MIWGVLFFLPCIRRDVDSVGGGGKSFLSFLFFFLWRIRRKKETHVFIVFFSFLLRS